MNVPMYNALRRCNPLTTMLLAYVVFKKRPTNRIFVAIMTITVGAIVAGVCMYVCVCCVASFNILVVVVGIGR